MGFIRSIRRFVGNLHGGRKVAFFVSLIGICVIAILFGIFIQFYYKYSESDPLMIGINISAQKTIEELEALEAEFNGLFTNEIYINSENVKVNKIEPQNNIVYTGYNLVNDDENYYSVNAQVPVININTDTAKTINSQIKTEFYDKANQVMRSKNGKTVYLVSYVAYINKDVLSVVVKSSLKEEGKSEKVMVKAYNYSIPSNEILSFDDFLKLRDLTNEEVQSKINTSIKEADHNAKIIAEQYGNLYQRDLNSSIYKVENAETYFINQDGFLYLVYAYGNKDYTNEMDVIVF